MKSQLNSNTSAGLFFLLVVVVPVFSGLVYAALYSFGIVGILNTGFTTEHWKAILSGSPFWKSVGFSLFVAISSVVISLIFALAIALSWKKALHQGMLSTVIYLPLCFPGTVMAFFMFQILSKSGFLSRLGFASGILDDLNNFPAFIQDAYGVGIILTSVFLITPFFCHFIQ